MMIRTLCLLFLAGLAAARPSAEADAKIMYRYLVPGSYYPYYGVRSLDGEPMTNVAPEEVIAVEDIKTPEETEPILHLGGVPVATLETKEVEEPIKEEVKETEDLDEESEKESDIEDVTEKAEFETETIPKDTTPEILPEIADVTEKVEFINVPEEAVIIAEDFTQAPMVVEVVTEKDDRKNLTGIMSGLSVLVKPLSQYSQYLPALSQYSSYLPSMSWFPSFSSLWPFRYADASRYSERVY